jgi:hypothetical protein
MVAARPARCSTTARAQEDDPVTWETLAPPRERTAHGEPDPNLRRPRAGARARKPIKKKRSPRGRPKARGTGAEAEGTRESEGRIGAMTVGNGLAAGPTRAKAQGAETSKETKESWPGDQEGAGWPVLVQTLRRKHAAGTAIPTRDVTGTRKGS